MEDSSSMFGTPYDTTFLCRFKPLSRLLKQFFTKKTTDSIKRTSSQGDPSIKQRFWE
jgi:hypothetical protein